MSKSSCRLTAMILAFIAAGVFPQTDPLTQPVNSWKFQYKKAAIGDVTHPYENGFSWDYKNDIGIVFGGHLGTYAGQSENAVPDIYNTNMTFLFSFTDNKFSRCFPMDRPAKRCGVKSCYDDNLGLTLIFGGAHHGFFNGYLEPNMRLSGLAEEGRRSTTVPYQLAPWGYNGGTGQWHAMRPLITYAPSNTSPYYGFSVNYAFAKEFGLVMMMPTQYNRVYGYSAYSNQWVLLPYNAADTAFPPVESYPLVAYDLKHRRLITYFANSASNETWSFDAGSHSWTKLALSANATASSTGWNLPFGSMAYDRKNGVHIYLKDDGAETWALDLDSMKWTQCIPSGAPPSAGTMGEGLTYDPVRNVSIVYAANGDEVWTYKYGPGLTDRPEPPSGLQGVTGSNSITLTWNAPTIGPAPSRYNIYRCEWEDNKLTSSSIIPGPYLLADSVTGLTWTDTNTAVIKKSGVFHSYYIASVAGGQVSDPSEPVYTRLCVPQALTATVISKTRVVLRWKPKPETDLAGYNIYRAQGPYPRQIAMKSVKLNSAPVTGMTLFEDTTMKIAPDTLAMYTVTAVNLLGKESGLSGFATTAADWPVNLWADTTNKILTWSPPRNGSITGYRIYESPVDTFDEIMDGYVNKLAPIATTTDTFWSYASRNPVGAYKIRAINVLGQEGHFSDVFDIQNKDLDTMGYFRLDYMTEKPLRDAFYDDLPAIRVETPPEADAENPCEIIPNPCNPSALIRVPATRMKGVPSLRIFDVNGRQVCYILKGEKRRSGYEFVFNGSRRPSGVYTARISDGKTIYQKKMVLIK
jgi:hypothetical protein